MPAHRLLFLQNPACRGSVAWGLTTHKDTAQLLRLVCCSIPLLLQFVQGEWWMGPHHSLPLVTYSPGMGYVEGPSPLKCQLQTTHFKMPKIRTEDLHDRNIPDHTVTTFSLSPHILSPALDIYSPSKQSPSTKPD